MLSHFVQSLWLQRSLKTHIAESLDAVEKLEEEYLPHCVDMNNMTQTAVAAMYLPVMDETVCPN